MSLAGKRIAVGISGGIAAFKAVTLVRELGRRGAEVRVVMTEAATRFVGPVTFTGITGQPAIVDLWDPAYEGEVHVELGAWADALVIAPATMNTLARLAQGIANDALTATFACARGPVALAPAMHHRMWANPATQRNVALLRADGVRLVGPVSGPLASGEEGQGRMSEPEAIADAVAEMLAGSGDLAGRRVVVSAGPTYEDLDPVRFLGNRSTGRMGYALAERAAARGAEVTLVSGPTQLPDPAGVVVVRVRSAREMHAAILPHATPEGADIIVMAAAVADYRPDVCAEGKIKKEDGARALSLVRNPDILADLGQARRDSGAGPLLVGFALETESLEANARGKLERKGADMIVANEARHGFGGSTNIAHLVRRDGIEALPEMSKRDLADRIWDAAASMLGESA